MSKKADKKKEAVARKKLVKDIRRLGKLIERIDTPLKIVHAQIGTPPTEVKSDKRA